MASPAVPGRRGLASGESLSGLRVGGGVAGRVLPGGGGVGGLDHLSGQVVVGVGGVQPPLAGGAGLGAAVGAGSCPVALVFGGVVQGGQQELDLGG
jgi:hypothetical protein